MQTYGSISNYSSLKMHIKGITKQNKFQKTTKWTLDLMWENPFRRKTHHQREITLFTTKTYYNKVTNPSFTGISSLILHNSITIGQPQSIAALLQCSFNIQSTQLMPNFSFFPLHTIPIGLLTILTLTLRFLGIYCPNQFGSLNRQEAQPSTLSHIGAKY